MGSYQDNLNHLYEMSIQYAPKLALAIIVLLVGLWVINRIVVMIGNAMNRTGLDQDIQPFLRSLIGAVLKVLLVFSVAGIVGVETTSFVAVFAAAGFAVGMALQGSLSNFASGVMVLIFKPYKVGDLIEVEDEIGEVKEVQIFNTIIETVDRVTVIIPNSNAISGKIKNFTTVGFRRVDLNVHMPYEESFPKVQSIILKALEETPKVLKDPAPFVGIESNDSHNIILAVRPHAKTDDYWDVYFEAYKNVKAALSENNIRVAYSEGVELGPVGK